MKYPYELFGGVPVHHDPRIALERALDVLSCRLEQEINRIRNQTPSEDSSTLKRVALKRLGFGSHPYAFEQHIALFKADVERKFASPWFKRCREQIPKSASEYHAFYLSVGLDWLDSKTIGDSRFKTMACRGIFNQSEESSEECFEKEPMSLKGIEAERFYERALIRGFQILTIESERDLEGWFNGVGGIGLVSQSVRRSKHKLTQRLELVD